MLLGELQAVHNGRRLWLVVAWRRLFGCFRLDSWTVNRESSRVLSWLYPWRTTGWKFKIKRIQHLALRHCCVVCNLLISCILEIRIFFPEILRLWLLPLTSDIFENSLNSWLPIPRSSRFLRRANIGTVRLTPIRPSSLLPIQHDWFNPYVPQALPGPHASHLRKFFVELNDFLTQNLV